MTDEPKPCGLLVTGDLSGRREGASGHLGL